MPYIFATQDQDYSDYSSGQVLYSQPGTPAFPVRLASEILQRARHILGADRPGKNRRLALFDPTCGGAYSLTVLGLLHGEWIESITASDIDPDALSLARRNLELLSISGIKRRVTEIEKMYAEFGKESHAGALRSAAFLCQQLERSSRAIPTRTFLASVFDSSALSKGLSGSPVDLVISDVPYGQLSAWHSPEDGAEGASPLQRMLAALLPVLNTQAVIVIAADKHQKVVHEAYRRAGHFGIGKREVTFLIPSK